MPESEKLRTFSQSKQETATEVVSPIDSIADLVNAKSYYSRASSRCFIDKNDTGVNAKDRGISVDEYLKILDE